MNIVGGRQFVEIAGERLHELPPLLIHALPDGSGNERVMHMASRVVETEELIPTPQIEMPDQDGLLDQRKLEIALQLVEQYQQVIEQWSLGDSILEWIRQCETTFENRLELKPLLRPDLWPHASRVSFVTLLRDKGVDTQGIEPGAAVGMRLAFRQPPPLRCFSDQFLMYLKGSIAVTAFETWAKLSPAPVSSFPPERFHFDVVKMAA